MTSREGVEIDYCPTCRGVWLDRGELDKIIERSLGGGAQPVPPAAAGYGQQDQGQSPGYAQDDTRYRDGGYGHDNYGGHGQSRGHGGQGGHGGRGGRGSFLSRLFD
ncbi:MAG: zf-TFIIB domain-containing protein [Devosia sp.]